MNPEPRGLDRVDPRLKIEIPPIVPPWLLALTWIAAIVGLGIAIGVMVLMMSGVGA